MPDNKPLAISIELSQQSGSVAAIRGGGDIVETSAIQGDRDRDTVMPAIERAVLKVGGTPDEVNTIFVSIGPGSFTGLRVATATAKMISFVTGAIVVSVETALGVVFADSDHVSRSIVVSAIKKNTCWLSIVTNDPTWCCEGRLVNISDVPTYMEQNTVLYSDSFLPDEITKACEEFQVSRREMQSSARSILEAGKVCGIENNIDPIELLPLYPREPEAVRKWKEVRSRRR
ncbi:MAG: tRNA (adenosine(37)-N6)-threonylcarbamoyltransferase complex dimerization subunit type 1 TsaB [Planctomycetes bacterium]|nr:tRNA (adenosine(37)-N6)-threonylcarbamoyltransferase complex dimerization subunit type 1 TsaB [Planctomycetota bacterium]